MYEAQFAEVHSGRARARFGAGRRDVGGFCGDLRLRGRPPAPKAAPGARASRARQRGGARARWARASTQLIIL